MNVIVQSTYYTLYQAADERCFYLDFGQKIVRMSLCQLLSLRHKVMSINIESHFDSDLNAHGFEVLMLCNKEHLFILNTLEVLDLKKLVSNSFVSLGLSADVAEMAVS
ncbi:MAG: hypothetical protein VX772_02085 [Bacteroidota bacterium]|jgi:hypothetical protein|nr:hypothetical protein [Allomuricauda sp.]MEC8831121.1 hypothetical protein [Bacteroidota bacterium]MBO6617335.1 hypothetical protein [Allomuricauda sp.]MBO6643654.1 hypothetical protein [Allomuricauda sp.]MBO6745670.1 hypothetical protein [Allomuricauda sp.]